MVPTLNYGSSTLETVGSVRRGRQVWVLARIRDKETTIGDADEIARYILLSNSHDGSLPVRMRFTPARVVCNNTLCTAHGSEASTLLRIRHTSGLYGSLRSIREIMDLPGGEFYATSGQYRTLMKRRIDKSTLELYVRIVFSLLEEKGKELIPKILHLYDHGRGSDMAGNTCWGAYDAFNGYLNYFRGKTQDDTLSSLWFGDSARVNKRALDVTIEMAT